MARRNGESATKVTNTSPANKRARSSSAKVAPRNPTSPQKGRRSYEDAVVPQSGTSKSERLDAPSTRTRARTSMLATVVLAADANIPVKAGTSDKFWLKTSALVFTLCAAACIIAWLFHIAPPLSTPPESCAQLSANSIAGALLPQMLGGTGNTVDTVRSLWKCASVYHAESPVYTAAVLGAIYVALQAFAIPGPLLLSVVAGALYGPWNAQVFIAVCATTGACLCYGLSHTLARPLVQSSFPDRIADMRTRVFKHKDNLFWYMLFLRITPMCPNWLVNLASPLVGVPFFTFAGATFLGLLPANFFHAHTGASLQSLSASESWSLQDNGASLFTLIALQFVALIPALLKSRLAKMDA
jgi:uncharacterized membrane protein YdjX (TVP38/TMEM64 family)